MSKISCPVGIRWSEQLASTRQAAAIELLGRTLVAKIIAFALFLLGANREQIGELVEMPHGTLLSLLTRMSKFGMSGLEDRRRAEPKPEPLEIKIEQQEDVKVIQFPQNLGNLIIKDNNQIQAKVVILTMANNGVLTWQQATDLLKFSSLAYTKELGDKLSNGDVNALLDRRIGQTCDYRVGEEKKGKLIVLWAANVVTGVKSSSRSLATDLLKQGINLPDRTIRHHMKKLGLVGMKDSLLGLITELKKNSTK